MLYNIPTTTPIRPAKTPPSRMLNPFLGALPIGIVGLERPVVVEVAALWSVVTGCVPVPEGKLSGDEVAVTVVVGLVGDVGGGGGRLSVEVEVEVEQVVEDDDVVTVEFDQKVEDEVEVEDDSEVGDDGEAEDDDEVGNDSDVGQGGYNTIVVVAHPLRQAVSQAVVV